MRAWWDCMPGSVRREIEAAGIKFQLLARPEAPLDAAHIFVTSRADMQRKLKSLRPLLAPPGFIWVSWPKKASKVPTDITEQGIRDVILPHTDLSGARAVADPRTGATGYTGSRGAGLTLKAAADAAGKPIYLELSSVNPVMILPGAIAERGDHLAGELVGSCLMGTGQFCTSPSLVVLFAGEETERFVGDVRQRLETTEPTPLLSRSVARSLASSVTELRRAGASVVTGGAALEGTGYRHANTLLRVDGAQFLREPHALQTEAFGNVSLAVVVRDADEAAQVLQQLEGNLTGSIYSDTHGADEVLYWQLEPLLRTRVGRLLNDKMPAWRSVPR